MIEKREIDRQIGEEKEGGIEEKEKRKRRGG